MSEKGLAATPTGTTPAPDLELENKLLLEKLAKYVIAEEAVDDNVAKGCMRVTEIIAYDFVGMEDVIDELTDQPTGAKRKVEKGRGPFFCTTAEEEAIFKANNPEARLETFGIQLVKATARKYLDDPENKKQFVRRDK